MSGKLTIFFGAAPGVGKTYSLLQAARSEREAGRDVVLGVIETHGHSETAALKVVPVRIDLRQRRPVRSVPLAA